jgi:PPOX class probable F420-dependent enzyme
MPDAPLLERLAALPPVPVSELVALLGEPRALARDPVLAGLVGADEQGEPALHPLLLAVVEGMQQRPDATCYGALIEALTGIWNAAVRGALVTRLRASGLPPDDLLLRLGALSPTLGFQADDREWARAWMGDPTARDAALVQQCMVRLLVAIRGLAGARAQSLAEGAPEARREFPSSGPRGPGERSIAMSFPDSHKDLLQKKAFANLATVNADGSPQVTPVWFDADGGFIRINTARGRVKDKNLRRSPMVALSVMDPDNPYRYVQVKGRVVEATESGADAHIDALAKKYMGVDKYPNRREGEVRVTFKIRPERVQTMG